MTHTKKPKPTDEILQQWNLLEKKYQEQTITEKEFLQLLDFRKMYQADNISPYEGLKNQRVWQIVEHAIDDLTKNNTIRLTEHKDYIVGHLVKSLVNNPKTNGLL
jgi:hypothetical protein